MQSMLTWTRDYTAALLCVHPCSNSRLSVTRFSWRAVLLRHCELLWQSLHWRRWRLNIPLCSCALSWLRSVYLGTMVGRAAVVFWQKVQCCLLSNELKTHVLQTCTCRIKRLGEKYMPCECSREFQEAFSLLYANRIHITWVNKQTNEINQNCYFSYLVTLAISFRLCSIFLYLYDYMILIY